MMTKNEKGFTLVELLVVVSIIGLLSTLAVVALGSARTKARDARRVSDIRQMSTALELYFSENNSYPTESSPQVLGLNDGTCLNASGFSAVGCADPFMGSIPRDPSLSGAVSLCTVASTAPCDYAYSGGNDTYSILFYLEGPVASLQPGLLNATPTGIN